MRGDDAKAASLYLPQWMLGQEVTMTSPLDLSHLANYEHMNYEFHHCKGHCISMGAACNICIVVSEKVSDRLLRQGRQLTGNRQGQRHLDSFRSLNLSSRLVGAIWNHGNTSQQLYARYYKHLGL